MNRPVLSLLVFLCLILSLIFVSTGSAVQVEPATLNYQGTLTDNSGVPLTGAKTITVRLYTVPSGGTAFWSDTYSVTLLNGQFSVVLGSDSNPLTPQITQFTGETYIGLQAGSDPEMTPRQKMTSVAYSFKAKVADSVNNSASIIPSGTVVAFAGTTAPTGWLMCNGQAVPRTTYSALFAIIGTSHGYGDNSTTFNVPDYRGRFLRGVDGAAGRDEDKASRTAMNTGGSTGNSVGSVQGDDYKAHSHTGLTAASYTGVTTNAYRFNAPTVVVGSGGIATNSVTNIVTGSISDPAHTHAFTTANAPTSNGNETRPENAYVNWIIKY